MDFEFTTWYFNWNHANLGIWIDWWDYLGKIKRWKNLPYSWILLYALVWNLPCRVQKQQKHKREKALRKIESKRFSYEQHNVCLSKKEVSKTRRPLCNNRNDVSWKKIDWGLCQKS